MEMKSGRNLFYTLILPLFLFPGCDTNSPDPPETIGMFPAENLDAAQTYALDDRPGLAFIVWQNGEILTQSYRQDYNSQTLHWIFSGSKSFAGLLAAIAVKNGLFTFDTTLGELITDWDPESERGKITIRQLLNLTSGIQTENAGTLQTEHEWLSADMVFPRGSMFIYGPTPFYIFSWIFHEELGLNPIDYLNEHLFQPLGISKGEWLMVDNRFINFAFGGNFTALDWLQTGILLSQNGLYNGQQLIPEHLLQELKTGTAANPGYGISFWVNGQSGADKRFVSELPDHVSKQISSRVISNHAPADLFMMSGLFGQKLYIVPSLDLVILRFGAANFEFDDDEFFRILMDDVEF